MHVIEVRNKKTAKEFIGLPKELYKNDPLWICPLDSDIDAVFNPQKNSFFTHGTCIRWILQNEKGQTIGRVAAFINHEKAQKNEQPTGGMGFFECINDRHAAFLLFDTVRQWLQQQGMEAMDGPINFGENDKYWGLLVEGFKPPSLGMNYNPPYYIDFFESYGFVKVYDQLTNTLDATTPLPERFTKISDWVMKKPGYTFEHFSRASKEKYFRDFEEIYNNAWSDFESFTPISKDTIRESFRQMEAIMDEKIIWFAYNNGEPIAFVLCLPDVNPILKPLKGSLSLVNKLRFLWYRKTTTISRLRIIIMGCKKKYQHIYLPLLYPFYLANWLLVRDFRDFFSGERTVRKLVDIPRREYVKLFGFKAFFLFYLVVLPVVAGVSWGQVLAAFAILLFTASIFSLLVLLSPHANTGNEFPLPDGQNRLPYDWMLHMLKTTNDLIHDNWFTRNLMGCFHFHVAHHLFPNINHVYYPEVTRHLKQFAQRQRLPYREHSLSASLLSHYRLLRQNRRPENVFEETM